MRLRKPLVAAAGAIGSALLLDRVLKRRSGELDPPLPGEQRRYRWRGMNVSYAEGGDPDDPDLVLFHGIHAAASSREWRPTFDALTDEYHVIAPDLPGFGRSDRPPIDYDAELYTDFVRDFTADVAPDSTCVASSLSGAYAVLAQREAGVFSRLVLICPTDTTTFRGRALGAALGTPIVGSLLFDVLTSVPVIRYYDARHGFGNPAAIDESDVAYEWRSAHQSGARYAPAAFASGRLDPEEDLTAAITSIASIDTSITLVWGREAELPPLSEGRDLAEIGDARLVVFDDAKLLPHVEYPDQFVDVVRGTLPRMRA